MALCSKRRTPEPPDANDDGQPFEGKEDRAWTEAVSSHRQEMSRDGSILTLVGGCPHCGHDMSVVIPVRARTRRRLSDKRDNASLGKRMFVKVAYCNCDGVHEDRPEGVHRGCGRFGALLVGGAPAKSDGPGGAAQGAAGASELEPFVSVKPSARKAAVSDVDWERRADDAASQALPNARAAAEKWTAAVATLTGVFSVALVVKGPDDVTEVGGNVVDLTPSWWPNALWFIVPAAVLCFVLPFVWNPSGEQRWPRRAISATIGLLVAAALLPWIETWSHFATVMVLLGLAVALAATAIVAGWLAAYGLPERYTAASGTLLRERQEDQALQARARLRVLLVATLTAMACIGGAIGLTWTNTDAPPPSKLLVLTEDGTTWCGKLVSAASPAETDQQLLVVLQDDERIEIASDEVRSMASVSACTSD